MKTSLIYLDYNATTPCAGEVVQAMLPFFSSDFANPVSTHRAGRVASRAVEDARLQIAQAIGALPEEIVFTSGATESNCMVISGLTRKNRSRRRIVVGSGEHKSVLDPCRELQERGFEVVHIPLTRSGTVSISDAEKLVNGDTLLVSVQGANNETGVLQPVEYIAGLAHSHGALMHCDATQMPGKVHVNMRDMGVDYASVSAHKVYGPKGIGVCYVSSGHLRAMLTPLLRGGGQEGELRSGTHNVPAIVGFGEACRLASETIDKDVARIGSLRGWFESRLLDLIPGTEIVGSGTPRVPGTSCILFRDVPADILLVRAYDLCISSGSACTSGTVSPSHVILACGFSRDDARSMVRVSFGRYSTRDEAERAAARLSECVTSIRDDMKVQTRHSTDTKRGCVHDA